MNNKKKPKYGKIIEGAEQLSLGISMVVAVLIGVGIGIFLKNTFHTWWLLWVGVFIGIAAAVLNVYKAYKKQVKEYDEFKDDTRYKKYINDEDEDEGY